MSAIEFQDWKAIYEIDPWTEDRADLRAGMISATIANAHSEDGGFAPSDFMPQFGPKPAEAEKTMDELKTAAMMMCGMLGGTFAKRNES